MASSTVSDLVTRIESYDGKYFAVESIYKNKDGNYCVEVAVKEEKCENVRRFGRGSKD